MGAFKLQYCLLAICFLAFGAHANDVTEAKPSAFKVSGHGDLQLVVPDGWTQKMQPVPAGLPPTILLAPKTTGARANCEVLITPMSGSDPQFNSPQSLKRLAEARGKEMLSSSKETTLDVRQLKSETANGYYFSLTDKAPGPGEFECMTACFIGVGDLMLTATILHHQKGSPTVMVALDTLKNATQTAAIVAAERKDQGNASALKLAAPGTKWELVLSGGLKILTDEGNASRKIRDVLAQSESTGMIVSVYFEPAANRGDSTAVRTVYWGRAKNSPIPKSNIKLGKVGEFATVEYMVPDVQQKNMNVYIAHQGTWIDIHLSKVGFTDKDQPQFDAIVKSIKFLEAGTK